MPVAVVDGLEVVEVEEEDEGAARLHAPHDVGQRAPVHERGQGVAVGHPPQVLLGGQEVAVGLAQLAGDPVGQGEDAGEGEEPLGPRVHEGMDRHELARPAESGDATSPGADRDQEADAATRSRPARNSIAAASQVVPTSRGLRIGSRPPARNKTVKVRLPTTPSTSRVGTRNPHRL